MAGFSLVLGEDPVSFIMHSGLFADFDKAGNGGGQA